jgi:ATP-dependent Clp protease ATP-binding subunit ClpC
MDFLETTLPENIIATYPYPMAVAALRVNNSTENVEKFLALGRLGEITLKYLAVLALAEYLLPDVESDPRVQHELDKLPRPSLGVWKDILLACMQAQKHGRQRPGHIPELRVLYTSALPASNKNRSDILRWYSAMVQHLDHKPYGGRSISLAEVLHCFVRYRNKLWGHGIEKLTSDFCQQHGGAFLAGLVGWLGAQEFLSRYPLRYVKEVRKLGGQEVHVMFDYMGITGRQGARYVGPPYHEDRRFYACESDARPILCLFPLFTLHEQRVYVLDYYEHKDGEPEVGFVDCENGDPLAPERLSRFKISKLEGNQRHRKLPDSELPVPPQEDGLTVDETVLQPSLSDLLERLNESGRQALQAGLGEAVRVGRFWLGVEFVLMGMSRRGDTHLSEILAEIGVDPGEFRGALRSLAGVAARSGWQRIEPEPLGMEAWGELRQTDGETASVNYVQGQTNPPVVTPRMMDVLRAALELAEGGNVGPDEVLAAALVHWQCPAVTMLLHHWQAFGKDPRDLVRRVMSRIKTHRAAPDDRVVPHVVPRQRPVVAEREHGAEAGLPPDNAQPAAPLPPLDGLLGHHGHDLTADVHAGRVHPAVGAEKLLLRIKRTLIRRGINNPLLVGEPGVGKTALVEGLAHDLVHRAGDLPSGLAGKRIVQLDVNSLIAGTRHHGEIEQRLDQLIQQVKSSPDVIVFIDELHAILGERGSGSAVVNALKPALARGEFRCIAASTIAEYRRFIEPDAVLNRRFETITVSEPSPEVAIRIATAHAEQSGLPIAQSVIEAAVHLSARYMPNERLPAKAIKLLDEAAAYVRLPSLGGVGSDRNRPLSVDVTDDLIRYLLSQRTGIPLTRLTGDERERISGIEGTLGAEVIGQPAAVHAVAQVIKAAYAGVRDPRKPIGVFLFVGPTGVGKTELARAVARFLFNDVNAMIRLDMSEYMEKHQVSRLIGAPPGYVGHEEEGQLTGKLRLRPHSVVLLDEIEKAHDEVHNLFLQLFDEGRLTDSKGRTVDARDAIFIMTSNVGADHYAGAPIGYLPPEVLSPEWLKQTQDAVDLRLKERFKPEFRNRIDRIVHFKPLVRSDLPAVFEIQLSALRERLQANHRISLTAAPEAIRFVCDRGYDALNGVRPLKRAIQQLFEEPVTDLLLTGRVQAGDTIAIACVGDALRFHVAHTGRTAP